MHTHTELVPIEEERMQISQAGFAIAPDELIQRAKLYLAINQYEVVRCALQDGMQRCHPNHVPDAKLSRVRESFRSTLKGSSVVQGRRCMLGQQLGNHSTENSVRDRPEMLADDFEFIGPIIGPLDKDQTRRSLNSPPFWHTASAHVSKTSTCSQQQHADVLCMFEISSKHANS
eukprot:1173534-Amphidinium_carterae.1